MKQESVKVSIPKQWIKKIVPYVLTALLSVSGFLVMIILPVLIINIMIHTNKL